MYLKGNHIIKLIICTERRIGYTPCIDFTQQKVPSVSSKAATSASKEPLTDRPKIYNPATLKLSHMFPFPSLLTDILMKMHDSK